MELEVTRGVEGNQEGFCKHAVSTRKAAKENVLSLLSGAGDIVTRTGKKLSLSLSFLPSILLVRSAPRPPWSPRLLVPL